MMTIRPIHTAALGRYRLSALMIILTLVVSAIGLTVVLQIANVQKVQALTEAEFLKKAQDFCGGEEIGGPKGDSACRHGYRFGADGRNLAETCTSRTDYNAKQKTRCKEGFNKGKTVEPPSAGSTAPGAGAPLAPCQSEGFLNFPTWYKYLKLNDSVVSGKRTCNPIISGINDFWLIGLAAIEILLRVAILVAIIYVMLGGIKYITARGDTGSGGSPNKINQARTTIIDAMLGLVIAIIATAAVSYIAGRFSA